ncbi:MAG: Lrp/AsnC family transcriptional regulator [Kangiellaceae bacterium]|nr:Lrp/AsnC family transcriptional regulator [Kangiellaceae bacterium]MCW8999050.1 Lrp/AsnC family transcriptional regulator [Kangiellaceae bacterium]
MLTSFDIRLLNRVQKNFPVCHDPFALIADELAQPKQKVIERLAELKKEGFIRRLGGVLNHKKVGESSLAALKVPSQKLTQVSDMVSQFEEVNHNYLREHEYNLWFVVTAANQEKLEQVLSEIEATSKCALLVLPMLKDYYIDLAFEL